MFFAALITLAVAKSQVMEILNAPPQSSTLTCPACGMLCDDIRLISNSPIKVSNGCQKSTDFLEQPLAQITPLLNGKKTELDIAIQRAIEILQKAQQPLIAGLGTDVKGMRAVLGLAQKTGAILDHMHSESTVRNTLALQNSGWQTTTLTEIKNRADVILAIGTDIVSSHPRFLEKLVQNRNSLFDKAHPEVIYLGNETPKELPQILNALNALAAGKKIMTEEVGGISVASLKTLLQKLSSAQYVVLVWSASKFSGEHAELTIQSITRLIKKLNETTRVVGLPLNSGDGDTTVNSTCTWNTGFASNIRFKRNHQPTVEFKPYEFSGNKSLSYSDAMIWISSFNAHSPPNTTLPTIVLGHPNTQFERMPEVFIPIGIPGLDHTGTLFRMDSAVALPLKKARDSGLPKLIDVLRLISDGMAEQPC